LLSKRLAITTTFLTDPGQADLAEFRLCVKNSSLLVLSRVSEEERDGEGRLREEVVVPGLLASR